MTAPKKCRSCEAEIVWARTAGGSPIPLDAKPERRFVVMQEDPLVVQSQVTYVSHFATCPNADQHRKAATR